MRKFETYSRRQTTTVSSDEIDTRDFNLSMLQKPVGPNNINGGTMLKRPSSTGYRLRAKRAISMFILCTFIEISFILIFFYILL